MTKKEQDFLETLEELLAKQKAEKKERENYCPHCGRPYVDYWWYTWNYPIQPIYYGTDSNTSNEIK